MITHTYTYFKVYHLDDKKHAFVILLLVSRNVQSSAYLGLLITVTASTRPWLCPNKQSTVHGPVIQC